MASVSGCLGGSGTGREGRDPTSSLRYDGPRLTLSYWTGFTGADGAVMAALVREFNASQANIIVDSRTYPWEAFYPNLRDLTARGLGPDVGVMHADRLAGEAALRLIAPLDSIVGAMDVGEADFLESAWGLGTYQGVRYGIPLDVHCLAMFYNRDHLARAGISAPPADREGFDDVCRRLRDAAHAHPSWMPSEFPALQIFLGLLWQNGGEPYGSSPTVAAFHSDEGVSALMWMVGQVKKGYSPPNVQRDEHWLAFARAPHHNSVEFNGIWQLRAADRAGVHYGLAPLPTIGQHPALWANSHQFFVSRGTATDEHRLHASQVFLDFLSRQSSAWAAAGMIPARSSERGVGMYRTSKQHVLDDRIPTMHFMPAAPGLPEVTSATLGTAVRTAIRQQFAARETRTALEDAAARANALLDQNRKADGR